MKVRTDTGFFRVAPTLPHGFEGYFCALWRYIHVITLLYTILRHTACSIRTMYTYIDALHTMFYMPILCICIWYTKQLYVVVTHTHMYTHTHTYIYIYIHIIYTYTLCLYEYIYTLLLAHIFWHISFGTYQRPQNKSERYPQNQFSFLEILTWKSKGWDVST